jgi:hypothetical protein
MPFSVGQVSVGTAATIILVPTNSDKAEITIGTKDKDVVLGGADVTMSTGYKLLSGTEVTLKLGRNDTLYGITDTSPHTISFFVYTPN